MTGPAVSQRVPLGVANGAAGLDSAGRLLPAELPSSAATGVLLATTSAGTAKTARASTTISPGGSWCWFNGPIVVDYNGTQNHRYLGYSAPDGSVIVSQQDLATGVVTTFNLHSAFGIPGGGVGTSNDHSSPGIAVRPDGRLIVFYAQQQGSALYYRISTNPEDVTAWGSEQTIGTAGTIATYPRPHYIGSRLFLVHSCSPGWRVVYSDDNGATWSNPQLWLSSYPNPGGYTQTRVNAAQTRMDFIYSMHPNSSGSGYATLSDMYHGYFDGTTFFATDGTSLGTLAGLPTVSNPNVATQTGGITLASLKKVYDYTTNGLCWAWDVALGPDGNPVCVFSSYPNAVIGDTWTGGQAAHFDDHRYNYYRWNGTAWVGAQITAAGGRITDAPAPPASGFQEYQYSGGVALSQTDPTVVYLSRRVAPSLQFEIERWVTTDGYGSAWTSSPITVESDQLTKNLRPATPHNPTAGAPEAVWMQGAYIDYTNFATVIALSAPPVASQMRGGLLARPSSAVLSDSLLAAATAVNPAMLLPLAADLIDVSGNALNAIPRVKPAFGKGRYGDRQALTFDGTQILRTTYQPFQTGTVRTFFGWANRAVNTAGHCLFGSDDTGATNTDCGLRINSGSNDVQFWANISASAGAGSATWAAAWPGTSQWVHWALIKDEGANTVELYINGVSQGVVSYSTSWGSSSNYLFIGARGSFYAVTPADSFNGSEAVFGVYEGRLTVPQVQSLAGIAIVNSRQDLKIHALGRKAETYDWDLIDSTLTVALVSGTLVAKLIALKATDGPITGLEVWSTVSGATASATLFKVQILDSTLHVRATSNDFSASLAATLNLIPFTAPYYPPADGGYYAVVLAVYSGTAPQMLYRGNASALGVGYNGGLQSTLLQAGRSDVLGIGSQYGSLTGGTRGWWLGAY
jgi:hypothetical protein